MLQTTIMHIIRDSLLLFAAGSFGVVAVDINPKWWKHAT